MTGLLIAVGLVVVVLLAVALWPRRGPGPEPAPLESGEAREAIRAVIERRVR